MAVSQAPRPVPSPAMRILLLLRDLSPNGVTTYNRMLAQELRQQGHEVLVWPSLGEFTQRNWRCWLLHPALSHLIAQGLARLRPDVIYVNTYTLARVAHAVHDRLGIPWFACMHNGHSDKRMAQWARLFGNAQGLVTMCESLHDKYQQLVDRDTAPDAAGRKPAVLLSRLPIAMPALAQRPAQAPLTLTYCSRISGQKGPRCEAWLRAIALLPDAGQYRVMVVGGGSYLKQLAQVAAELSLTVEFTGMVPDTAPYLRRTDVLTGAGYALSEGLVRGCVGVGLGFGGCVGAVTPERLDEALAVNFGDHCPHPLPEDPGSIAAALQEAIALCGTPGARTVTERCRSHFEPRGIAQELVQFWKRSLPAPTTARR